MEQKTKDCRLNITKIKFLVLWVKMEQSNDQNRLMGRKMEGE